jgi:hypothetical protein
VAVDDRRVCRVVARKQRSMILRIGAIWGLIRIVGVVYCDKNNKEE